MNSRFVRMDRRDSVIADFDFRSTINCENNIFSAIYSGTVPMIGIGSARSSSANVVILNFIEIENIPEKL